MQATGTPIQGRATIHLRNVTIPNVRCVRTADGQFELPFEVSNLEIKSTRQLRESIRHNWYPDTPEL